MVVTRFLAAVCASLSLKYMVGIMDIGLKRMNRVRLAMLVVYGAFAGFVSPLESWGEPLHLDDFLRRVWSANESIQIKTLEAMISEERYKSEKGVFEPVLISSFEAVDRLRPNTTEQRLTQGGIFGGQTVFKEINRSYAGAVEMLVPSGAKVHFGYSLQSLENNLNGAKFPRGEFLSILGISVSQPLLKNAGTTVTLAGIRAAAISSEISFQEYRRGVMEALIRAELGYWDLYQAQEQYAISSESVRLAETLLTDNRKRLELGKGTELDVLQAEAGLAFRKALQTEANQRLGEARGKAAIFIAESFRPGSPVIMAADVPKPGKHVPDFTELWQAANQYNPDAVSLAKQAKLEEVRLAYARNQRLPELDLKGGYGASGIATSVGASWDEMNQHDSPAWTIGLEFHLPLWGGVKSAHEYKAAQLRLLAARRAIESLGTQLPNALKIGINNVEIYQENVPRYQKVVDFNQDVLKTQLTRLEAGKTDSRTVLQAEEDLFKAKLNLVDSMMRFQRSILELDLVTGTVLKKRNLDLTQKELQSRTATLTQNGRVTADKYQSFLQHMKKEYELRSSPKLPSSAR